MSTSRSDPTRPTRFSRCLTSAMIRNFQPDAHGNATQPLHPWNVQPSLLPCVDSSTRQTLRLPLQPSSVCATRLENQPSNFAGDMDCIDRLGIREVAARESGRTVDDRRRDSYLDSERVWRATPRLSLSLDPHVYRWRWCAVAGGPACAACLYCGRSGSTPAYFSYLSDIDLRYPISTYDRNVDLRYRCYNVHSVNNNSPIRTRTRRLTCASAL